MPVLFTDPYDVSPTQDGWDTIDISPYVPSNAAVAIVRLSHNNGSQLSCDVRTPGETYDPVAGSQLCTSGQIPAFCGIVDQEIDIYCQTYTKGYYYLEGYFKDSEATILSSRVDITPSVDAGNYQSIDVSSYVPAGKNIAIVQMVNAYDYSCSFYIRPTGSSDNLFDRSYENQLNYVLVPLDESRTFEVKNGRADNTLLLVGYVNEGLSLKTNALDVTTGGTGSYVDIDLSGDAPEGAEAAIIWVQNADAASRKYYAIRHYDSITDIYNFIFRFTGSFVVPLNESNVFKTKRSDTDIKTYVLGYFGAPPPDIPPNEAKFYGSPQFPNMSAYGLGLTGVVASGAIEFPSMLGFSSFYMEDDPLAFPMMLCSGNGFWYDPNLMQFPMMTCVGYMENEQAVLSGEFPAMTAEGEGITGEVASGEAAFPMMDITAAWYDILTGTLEFPNMECTITMLAGGVASLEKSFPMLTSQGNMLVGQVASGEEAFPMMGIDIPFHIVISLQFPEMTAVGTGITGEVASGSNQFPMMVSSINVITGSATASLLKFPMMEFNGNMLVGQVGSINKAFPLISILGSGLTGTVASGSFAFPMMIITSSGHPAYVLNGTLVFPLMGMEAFGYQTVAESINSFMVNLKTGAVTKTGYPFRGMAFNGSNYLGCNSSGIYTIGGSNFNNSNIDAYFTTGLMDLGIPQLKRLTDGYITLKNAGTYQLHLKTDDGNWNTYTFTDASASTHTEKCQFGRGAKGRYWQLKFVNQGGADFEIQSLELISQTLRKRMRGK